MMLFSLSTHVLFSVVTVASLFTVVLSSSPFSIPEIKSPEPQSPKPISFNPPFVLSPHSLKSPESKQRDSCIICYNEFGPNIPSEVLQCYKDHTDKICHKCDSKMTQCPICRAPKLHPNADNAHIQPHNIYIAPQSHYSQIDDPWYARDTSMHRTPREVARISDWNLCNPLQIIRNIARITRAWLLPSGVQRHQSCIMCFMTNLRAWCEYKNEDFEECDCRYRSPCGWACDGTMLFVTGIVGYSTTLCCCCFECCCCYCCTCVHNEDPDF